jgi:hypothetical protein
MWNTLRESDGSRIVAKFSRFAVRTYFTFCSVFFFLGGIVYRTILLHFERGSTIAMDIIKV